jgi:two-component system, NarL family, sensor kinase
MAAVLAAAAVAVAAAGLYAYASVPFHGNPYALHQLAVGASAVLVGAYVAFRRPDHPLGWLLLVAGAGAWVTFAGSSWLDRMFQRPPVHEAVGRTILHLATPGWIVTHGVFVALIPVALPEGWRSSRRARAQAIAGSAAIGVTAVAHSRLFTFEHFDGVPPVGTARIAEDVLPWGHRAIWVCAAFALVDMIARLARAPRDVRRRYRWLAASVALLSIPTLDALYDNAFGSRLLEGAFTVEEWTQLLLPLVLAVGILRDGLLDIGVVVQRATVYGVLAVVAGAIYVTTVAVFAAVSDGGSGAGPVVAAGLIAIAVVPAYTWVQRTVDRLVFGNRADPYAVVAALGQRLEQAPPGDQALQLVTDTLRQQLRLPYVAVELDVAGASVVAASSGTVTDEIERHALVHQGVTLGSLAVGWRTSNEPFRPSEQALLTTFARQVSVVAHNAALAEALRRSRAVLLETREQERLRIRRDLHDGLGATLASVALGLGAAADRLAATDESLVRLLRDLEAELADAIADIRRLVHELRPPVLDQLGLVEAVREHVRTLQTRAADGPDDVSFEIVAPASRTPLPAPVELAAYRVALEAMTNVVRHARASRCRVIISQEKELGITVEDDGRGVAIDAHPGVGFNSMRDRVLELGGTLDVCGSAPRGTRVTATFPLDGIVGARG